MSRPRRAADVEQLVALIQHDVQREIRRALTPEFRTVGEPALMRLRHDPKLVRHVTDAREFGRVAVLFGGTSTEREISLLSGNACLRRCSSAASTRIPSIRATSRSASS